MNLPEGFTIWAEERDQVVVLGYLHLGLVTIDYRTRGWALGGMSRALAMGYTGRGWRKALEIDAMNALKEIFKDEK